MPYYKRRAKRLFGLYAFVFGGGVIMKVLFGLIVH